MNYEKCDTCPLVVAVKRSLELQEQIIKTTRELTRQLYEARKWYHDN